MPTVLHIDLVCPLPRISTQVEIGFSQSGRVYLNGPSEQTINSAHSKWQQALIIGINSIL